jgi:hypothetical protein
MTTLKYNGSKNEELNRAPQQKLVEWKNNKH